jgi:hypothetical protein
MNQALEMVNFFFTKQRVHTGHDTVMKMRSLDPTFNFYAFFEDKYFQKGMNCNIPYCILHLMLFVLIILSM